MMAKTSLMDKNFLLHDNLWDLLLSMWSVTDQNIIRYVTDQNDYRSRFPRASSEPGISREVTEVTWEFSHAFPECSWSTIKVRNSPRTKRKALPAAPSCTACRMHGNHRLTAPPGPSVTGEPFNQHSVLSHEGAQCKNRACMNCAPQMATHILALCLTS